MPDDFAAAASNSLPAYLQENSTAGADRRGEKSCRRCRYRHRRPVRPRPLRCKKQRQRPENGAAILRGLLATNKKVIGVSFGNPYVLGSFPEMKTYLVAYGDMPGLQRAAAKAMLGLQDITGKLPISLPGLYPRGTGIQLTGPQASCLHSSDSGRIDATQSLFRVSRSCRQGACVPVDKHDSTLGDRNFLDIRDGRLHIDGVDAARTSPRTRHAAIRLQRIADSAQHRPSQKGRRRYSDCPLKICYAAKAMSTMGILRAVKDAGMRYRGQLRRRIVEGAEDRISQASR